MGLRLFLAIKPPEEITESLEVFIGNLNREYWKPAKIDQLHITLAFMGQVPEDSVDHIVHVAGSIAKNASPFRVMLTECDAFPGFSDPRVLYAKAESAQLVELGNSLRTELSEFVDAKKFKPHLTLARPRKRGAGRVIRKIRCGWNVKGFSLVKSTLNESGALHEQLKFFNL